MAAKVPDLALALLQQVFALFNCASQHQRDDASTSPCLNGVALDTIFLVVLLIAW